MPKLPIALSVACLFALGCGSGAAADASGEQGGKLSSMASSSPSTHATDVAACNEVGNNDSAVAMTTAEMEEIPSDWAACLHTANDAAVALIEKNLVANSSPYVGKTSATLDASRAASSTFCNDLELGSQSYGGSAVEGERDNCVLQREKTLAALIDAYAPLDGAASAFVHDTTHFASCYGLGAASQIESCVDATFAADETAIVGAIVANGANSYPDVPTLQQNVTVAITAVGSSTTQLCQILADATAGGSSAATRCSADADSDLGGQMMSFSLTPSSTASPGN